MSDLAYQSYKATDYIAGKHSTPCTTDYCQQHHVWWSLPSVLWRCWLGGRKGIRPVKKTDWWGAGVVICLEWGADLHMAQLTPLPLTVSCFSKIPIGFTFLVLAQLGSPGQRVVPEKGPLNVCVCVSRMTKHVVCSECKNWVMRHWCGYLSGARCRFFAYGPADATASQNPNISCLI